MSNLYSKLAAAFVAGLLIGIGSTWLWFTEGQDNLKPDTSQLAGDEVTADLSGKPGVVASEKNWVVVVEDQFPGNKVILTAVSFTEPGWVAIYEDNNGEPGNILGAQRFDAGEHTGAVELLRGTGEGSLYYAILHYDDGDKEFNLEKDTQLVDENGNRIETKFQTPPHRN